MLYKVYNSQLLYMMNVKVEGGCVTEYAQVQHTQFDGHNSLSDQEDTLYIGFDTVLLRD
jgi:hypothetical protein